MISGENFSQSSFTEDGLVMPVAVVSFLILLKGMELMGWEMCQTSILQLRM